MAGAEQRLILVDSEDRVLGSLDRSGCHSGEGRLHRAFSILAFDRNGRLLLQRRSSEKELWAGYWSNSCCGHPLEGEGLEAAAVRRLGEELGFRCPLQQVMQFQYAAPFGERGSERELCSVFLGRHDGAVHAAPEEIAEWRWIGRTELRAEMAADPLSFTPWFRAIWRVLDAPGGPWTAPPEA